MLQTTEKIKRTKTYLTSKQKWAIATYCIENRNVIQDIDPKNIVKGKFYPYSIWRVRISDTAKEINKQQLIVNDKCLPEPTPQQIVIGVEFYNEICEVTQHHPEPKPIQETVEMDQLKITNKRLETDIKEMSANYQKLDTLYKDNLVKFKDMQKILKQITQIIPAWVYSSKV